MTLVFDTETTGKATFGYPASHPTQPHLVQLGAILCDHDFNVRGEINLIVRPDGWFIPDQAAAVHGITTDLASKYGLPKATVLNAFCELASKATVCVAHNTDFDFLVMSVFLIRCNGVPGGFDYFRDQGFCTMKAMIPICQLPPNFPGADFKFPSLKEAYRHAFGQEFDGAHDAMADVRACLRLYRWIKESPDAPFV